MRKPTPEELQEIGGGSLRQPTQEELAEIAPALKDVAISQPSIDPLREVTGGITQTQPLKELEDMAKLKLEDLNAAVAGLLVTEATVASYGALSIPLGMAAAALAGGSTHYAKTGDVKSSLAEGGIQALFEGIPGAWVATRRHARPLKRFVKDYQLTAMREMEAVGGHLTLDQAVKTSLIDKLADMSESSFFGGGRLKQFKGETQREFLEKIWANTLDGIRPGELSTTEAGTIFSGAMEITERAIKGVSDEMYANLYNATDSVRIPLANIERGLGIERIAPDPMLVGVGDVTKPFTLKTGRAQSGDTVLNRVIDDVMDLSELHGGTLSFEDADGLLKGINRELAKATKSNDRQAIRKLGEAKKLLRGEIDEVIEPLGLVEHYDYVLSEYGKMASVMRNEFVTKLYRNIAEQNPELVAKKIKGGRPSDIQRIKDVLLDPPMFGGEQLPKNPEAWQAIKRSYLQDRWDGKAVAAAIDDSLGKDQINRFLSLDNESMNILFDKDEIQGLTNFMETAIAQGEKLEKGGGMLIQLMQAGALLEVGGAALAMAGAATDSGGLSGAGAFLLIAPWKMGRMLSDKKFVKMMTVGLTTPTSSDAITRLLPRLYRRYAELSMEDERGPSMMVPIEDLGAFEGPGQVMFGGQTDVGPDETPITP